MKDIDLLKNIFQGKVCSILTNPISINLDKSEFSKWMTIQVDLITDDFILGTDLLTGTKSAFFFPIQGIIQEQVIEENTEEYQQAKKMIDMKKNNPIKPISNKESSIDDIEKVIQKMFKERPNDE